MYFKSLIIKFIIITAVLSVILGWYYGINFTNILIISILLTAIGFVSDILILPRSGNILALIIDFVLTIAVIWIVGSFIFNQQIALGTASTISALVLIIGELLLHRYMSKRIYDKKTSNSDERIDYYQRASLQTEFAEEADIEVVTKRAKDEG
ncbi:DUF2512 family protein [Psychrobacillus vulpis]|uniref:DUF2512 family protein n=1 Tax=Psychrobacillus vulpis TaxID=2325572 RepID=A0A544TW41_9BACI|nr:DUF2512 family protein [Psychrobacillus vulpis]TQR21672.1 DUF2512 family protein [Psychrobacillus vulpis]